MAGLKDRRWLRWLDAGLCVAVLGGGVVAVALHDGSTGPCGAADSESLAPREVLDCLGDDIAHVTTTLGSGSAVLLADGRLLTNAHVVDPFAVVDVSFRDGLVVDDVPVIGVDLQRDVAVLGPIDREGGVELADQAVVDGLGQGDDLFLVGYPGELETGVSDPTISQGILSRVRVADRFGQTFLQTDAAIGGGQSGGALVDGAGHVVGLSGLSFADNFALGLSSTDVAAGLAGIDAGQSGVYRPIDAASATTTGTFTATGPQAPLILTVPPADVDQPVQVTFDRAGAPLVTVQDSTGQPLWLPPTLLREASPEELDMDQGTYDRLRGSAGDNDAVASFTVPAGRFGVVLAESLVGPEGALTYTSSVPLSSFPDGDNGVPLTIGTRHEGAIETFEALDTFTVDLAQGQALDVYLGAVAGDMVYWIYPVGGEPDEANIVDDSNEGLYGLDAHETFTAPAAGAYVIEVSTYESISVGYVLDAQPG